MIELCSPALIYLIFSLIQIIYDTYNKLYNTALLKFLIMIIITFLLNTLCQKNLAIISWLLVSIPFIMMTTITVILIYIFGFNKTTGKINCNLSTPTLQVATATTTTTTQPQATTTTQPQPAPQQSSYSTSATTTTTPTTFPVIPINYSSSPAYQ